jgi:hypothetical protein
MRYEISDRIQHENYCCPAHFMEDVIDTLFSEDLETDKVHIIADTELTEVLFKVISQITVNDFEFDFAVVDYDKFDDEIDEYCITILNDGEVFIEKAIDKNANYFELDGFVFAESEVSEDVYNGRNRHCDVMVFSIDEYEE